MTTHHDQPPRDTHLYSPLPLAVYLDPEGDQDQELTVAEAAFRHTSALLDAIIDGHPWPVEEDLVLLLAGPFGVDWRAGHPPTEAPPTSWEPTVLELGHAVAEALHLDPLWADDPADYA